MSKLSTPITETILVVNTQSFAGLVVSNLMLLAWTSVPTKSGSVSPAKETPKSS